MSQSSRQDDSGSSSEESTTPSPPSPTSTHSKPRQTSSLFPSVDALVEQTRVLVWRLPGDISQSRLGGRDLPSNACTIIAVRLAELLHRTDTAMPYTNKAMSPSLIYARQPVHRLSAGTELDENRPQQLICPLIMSCLVEAILDGNAAHEKAVFARMAAAPAGDIDGSTISQNFTIPEAIVVHKSVFLEVDFCSLRGMIRLHLPRYIRLAISNPCLATEPRLFLLMIAYERAVLIVYERSSSSLTLFDTHNHGISDGTVIASCHLDDLSSLSHWISTHIFPEANSQPRAQNFELSLIRFCGTLLPTDCALPSSSPHCLLALFRPAPPMAVKISGKRARSTSPPSHSSFTSMTSTPSPLPGPPPNKNARRRLADHTNAPPTAPKLKKNNTM